MKPGLVVSIIAVVALMIAGAATIVLARNQPPRPSGTSDPAPARPPSLPPNCLSRIEIGFRTDEEMAKASDTLENDQRFYRQSFLTKAQHYEQLKRLFADQPDVLATLRPESVPALASLVPNYDDDTHALIASLKRQYGSVTVTDPCDTPASSKQPAPATSSRARR